MGGLVSPLPPNGNDSTIPTIVRNQGIRLGSKISGKALSSSGTSLIGYGLAQRRTPQPIRRFESVTKKSVRSKGGRIQKGTTYLSSNRQRADRQLHKTRYPNRPSRAVARSNLAIRGGVALRGAGKALPVLAVGYIGLDLLRGRTPQTDLEFVRGFTHGTDTRSVSEVITLGKNQYSQFSNGQIAAALSLASSVSFGIDVAKTLL